MPESTGGRSGSEAGIGGGDRPPRYGGDRPPRYGGDRPPRYGGDRPLRRGKDRPLRKRGAERAYAATAWRKIWTAWANRLRRMVSWTV
ncbi:MAG: hypothetical protein Kow0063_25870 [Anaerolineae bacterium]